MTKEKSLAEALSKTIDSLPSTKRIIADELVKECDYIKNLLNESRQLIEQAGLVSIYENGQQTNSRQTPEQKTYQDLIKIYKSMLKDLDNLLTANEVEPTNELQSFIERGEVLSSTTY
ncbi:hypothetical protein [Hutsoniella sourekii]|uniref:hypothetical protein n=1 Tax=Hutsoniella sourekii TaxID=87650 RepID=UPI000489FFB3|nr:hypothetical protein [Hutsoniella sourekii]